MIFLKKHVLFECSKVEKILRNGQKKCPKFDMLEPFWEKTQMFEKSNCYKKNMYFM